MTNQERHKLHLFIAQKVMGWKRKAKNKIQMDSHEFWVQKGRVLFAVGNANDYDILGFAPTYDYAQALQVLEKCADISPVLIINPTGKLFRVGWKDVVVDAPALPEAICLFARELYK